MSNADVWRHNGRKFGYKECCIDYFCGQWAELITLANLSIRWRRVVVSYHARRYAAGVPHGFVPCPACLTEMEGTRAAHDLTERAGVQHLHVRSEKI